MRFSRNTAALALLGAAYAASVFVAFRPKASDGGRSDRVTIRFSQWQLETGVRDAIDAIIRRYEQLNPRVHVEQIAIPGGVSGATYTTWVLTQMAAGDGPDLFEYDGLHPDVVRICQPIGSEVDQPNPYDRGTPLEGRRWRDTFVDGMNTNFDRNLLDYYSASLDVHTQRIIYNRNLMKAVTGFDAPPRTYRELLALCAAIRAYAAAHKLNLSPMANPPDTVRAQSWYITYNLTDHLAERIDFQHRLTIEPDDLGQSYLRGEWSYDTPEAVAAFQEVKEFGEMSPPGFWSRSRDMAVTDFVCGRAVMFDAPSWQATTLLGICNFPIAVFDYPYPREDDPVYGRFAESPYSDGPLIPGMEIFLNRATRHRAEALDFLKFMTSQEGGELFTRYSNWRSATVGVKPSPFATQFKFNSEGYFWNAVLFVPSAKNNGPNFILTHLPELWNPSQGLADFRKTMRDGMASQLREDFRHEVVDFLENLCRQDVDAVAQAVPAGSGRRPAVLPLVESVNEGILYQTRNLIDPPAPTDLSLDRLDLGNGGAAGPAAAAASPRQARFRQGVAVLGQQPVSEARIDEACRIFSELADSGTDDAALGARFFLGRVAQHHRRVSDPAEAARQYARLIRDAPDSVWAQTALSPLALLEIYALDASSPPTLRLARAGKLLALARGNAARSSLHMDLAYATFYYRLPPVGALPHLVAAAEERQIDLITRFDVLLQVAELARLAGDRLQAVRYYQTFLTENPVDYRCYLVRHRLAALQSGRSQLPAGKN